MLAHINAYILFGININNNLSRKYVHAVCHQGSANCITRTSRRKLSQKQYILCSRYINVPNDTKSRSLLDPNIARELVYTFSDIAYGL